ncbi:flavodoxin domain-containing protein [Marinomonas algarum]|uniref:NADPH--hemoprotein reductase n=1 Tax=Marinomonas algarum TaxID=2883105 RepID=A0A9X1ILQ7_9GAMM|nr:flavodoxin domain-containing protein [Marinomonas algarum]
MLPMLVKPLLYFLWAMGVFALLYGMGLLLLGYPDVTLSTESWVMENGMSLGAYTLHCSEEVGCFVLHQNTLLHRFSTLDIFLFKILSVLAVSVLVLAFLIGGVWIASIRLQKTRNTPRTTLITYASQTGSARQLAEQLYRMAHTLLDVRCISTLSIEQIHQYQRVFFVVSTCGEGAPPDSAQALLRELKELKDSKGQPKADAPMFAVLALGDRSYPRFCAFGHQLSSLMEKRGFNSLLPVHEVDKMNKHSIECWWQQVGALVGASADPLEIAMTTLTVQDNQQVNAPREDRAAHVLHFRGEHMEYSAGDLLAVYPEISPLECRKRILENGWHETDNVLLEGQSTTLLDALLTLDWSDETAPTPQALVDRLSPIHERLYSIASHQESTLSLLVRQHCRADGSLGNGSGYLCRLAKGDTIQAQLRVHESFRLHQDVPLIMIAAGTGVAPFRGFLQQKQQWQSQCEHWLIFGEQYAQYDDYFGEDFERFQAEGLLTHIDKAWSRSHQCYVQDILYQQSERLQEWVNQKGAQIYVCGSRLGFGEQVIKVLEAQFDADVLGACLHCDLY